MSTATLSRLTSPSHTPPTNRTSPLHRFFGVVAHSQSYRNIGYLLLGLPLGTIWFSALISGWSVAVSMFVVALLGIPLLVGVWDMTRACANMERRVANVLLGSQLTLAPMASPDHGNLWVRLRSMTGDRNRRRELGYLLWRFPVGVATFTAAVTALATPAFVVYAPFLARFGDDQSFGDWSLSSTIEDASSSPWSWFLVPLGLVMLIASFHLMNSIANACRRWATNWL
jgi:hypothetical protein